MCANIIRLKAQKCLKAIVIYELSSPLDKTDTDSMLEYFRPFFIEFHLLTIVAASYSKLADSVSSTLPANNGLFNVG